MDDIIKKIADVEAIKVGEKDLMDSITADLDWGVLQDIIRERHRLEISDDLEFAGGDLVVHDNQVAYRLNFEITVGLSVVLDRRGKYLGMETPAAVGITDPLEPSPAQASSRPAIASEDELLSEDVQPGLPDATEMAETSLAAQVQAPVDSSPEPAPGPPEPMDMAEAVSPKADMETASSTQPPSDLPEPAEMVDEALDVEISQEAAPAKEPAIDLPDPSEMLETSLTSSRPETVQPPDDGLPDLPDPSEMVDASLMKDKADAAPAQPAEDLLAGLPDPSELVLDSL